jgi:endoglucanase Acf2
MKLLQNESAFNMMIISRSKIFVGVQLKNDKRRILFQVLLGVMFGVALASALPVSAQGLKVGEGSVSLSPKGGDPTPPAAQMRVEPLQGKPAQTNQWYSTLLVNKTPEPIYAQPLSVRAVASGLEMAYPSKEIVPTERRDVEVHYSHRDALTFSPVAFEAGAGRLAKATDWAIDIDFSRGADQMLATVGHGSPYVFFRISRGDLRIALPFPAQRLESGADERVLRLKLKGKVYGFFGPSGVVWVQSSPQIWVAKLPEGRGYLSAAALPDDSAESLALLSKHAYAFTTDTRVAWKYDQSQSRVETRFDIKAQVMEGADNGPLTGLYPHQWFNNESVRTKLGPAYDTIRGKIRLLAAASFALSTPYGGFVPYWPAITNTARRDQLGDLMKTDLRNSRRMMLEIGRGPYWQGKGLQRIAKLMEVQEQQGNTAARDQLLTLMKSRIEQWFSGDSRKTYFHLDKTLGTLLSYPEEYFSVQQMNDHHFHYGYWIRAMADIALRDPEWASDKRWGGMVQLMIGDIATTQRDGAFPFLRTFDVYEGHSWASGVGLGQHGNNQESSSEAINAWAALILWGELTGNDALRDLGIYLYTNESEAIRHYWFDVHGQVFAPEYKHQEVSMLFGGKYSHNTWWTDEPRQIKGINLLPITSASIYLARDAAFIKRNLATLPADTETFQARGKRADPPDIWQDIFAKYLALSDASAALKSWDRWGAVEFGDTRSHTFHWMVSLEEMGQPDLSVTADTPLYSVFRSANGRLTYLAFNARKQPLTVRFSTGKVLQVAPGKLAKEQ